MISQTRHWACEIAYLTAMLGFLESHIITKISVITFIEKFNADAIAATYAALRRLDSDSGFT